MKHSTFFVLIALLIGILVLLLPLFGVFPDNTSIMPTEAADTTDISQQQKATSFDSTVSLRVLIGEVVTEMSLHDYLVGVLAAEMPSDFPTEALKAQTVAARTFALRQANAGKHLTADVCANPGCCQGWSSAVCATHLAAVNSTDGLVATYHDALIDATYFSCSGSRTESALAVWGSDIPYLQSVESPGEASAPRYTESILFDAQYFAERLRSAYPEISLDGTPKDWFGKITYTRGGGIDTAIIGGIEINGLRLRSLLSLRSTNISFHINENDIEITTYGFGHRVGMSQYGAKAMAEQGNDFEQILKHYYQGIEVKQLVA